MAPELSPPVCFILHGTAWAFMKKPRSRYSDGIWVMIFKDSHNGVDTIELMRMLYLTQLIGQMTDNVCSKLAPWMNHRSMAGFGPLQNQMPCFYDTNGGTRSAVLMSV